MIWNLIGTIGGKVLDIVDVVVEDPERDQEDAAAISGGGGSIGRRLTAPLQRLLRTRRWSH